MKRSAIRFIRFAPPHGLRGARDRPLLRPSAVEWPPRRHATRQRFPRARASPGVSSRSPRRRSPARRSNALGEMPHGRVAWRDCEQRRFLSCEMPRCRAEAPYPYRFSHKAEKRSAGSSLAFLRLARSRTRAAFEYGRRAENVRRRSARTPTSCMPSRPSGPDPCGAGSSGLPVHPWSSCAS